MLVISVVERDFRLGFKYLIPLKKLYSLDINYCTNYEHSSLKHFKFNLGYFWPRLLKVKVFYF